MDTVLPIAQSAGIYVQMPSNEAKRFEAFCIKNKWGILDNGMYKKRYWDNRVLTFDELYNEFLNENA